MAERAKAIQDKFENRQTSTQDTLDVLLQEIERDEKRKQEQARKGFDSLSYFVYQILENAGIEDPQAVSNKIREAFIQYPNWQNSEGELRELRKKVTFAIYAEMDDLEAVTAIVEQVFTKLDQAL
ncbi:hypothetical protein FRE64_03295 [Euhalothece natronophila Z-M001]|uniref:DUF3387 domain-containing protein n=1 Tax=Euhalothece natronophila Z-M001 TaxID=522448 RepID=A0A5B8NL44_9CHRO|nr:hypothetical protein [Euhalothece natronophila]QDZ39045.1 hypothetical protein FRE64_03295 [Euhalothece natronophila Z-M001]